jgi:hypothetical protein
MTTTTTTITTPTTTTSTAVDRLLEVVVGARAVGDDVFTPDAVVDAVVPGWRFPMRGAARIASQFATWFDAPGRLEELDRQPTPEGEVVSYTLTWVQHGVPHAARQVHMLTIVDDRITRAQVWCGGRWPAPLLAEMEEAARLGIARL